MITIKNNPEITVDYTLLGAELQKKVTSKYPHIIINKIDEHNYTFTALGLTGKLNILESVNRLINFFNEVQEQMVEQERRYNRLCDPIRGNFQEGPFMPMFNKRGLTEQIMNSLLGDIFQQYKNIALYDYCGWSGYGVQTLVKWIPSEKVYMDISGRKYTKNEIEKQPLIDKNDLNTTKWSKINVPTNILGIKEVATGKIFKKAGNKFKCGKETIDFVEYWSHINSNPRIYKIDTVINDFDEVLTVGTITNYGVITHIGIELPSGKIFAHYDHKYQYNNADVSKNGQADINDITIVPSSKRKGYLQAIDNNDEIVPVFLGMEVEYWILKNGSPEWKREYVTLKNYKTIRKEAIFISVSVTGNKHRVRFEKNMNKEVITSMCSIIAKNSPAEFLEELEKSIETHMSRLHKDDRNSEKTICLDTKKSPRKSEQYYIVYPIDFKVNAHTAYGSNDTTNRVGSIVFQNRENAEKYILSNYNYKCPLFSPYEILTLLKNTKYKTTKAIINELNKFMDNSIKNTPMKLKERGVTLRALPADHIITIDDLRSMGILTENDTVFKLRDEMGFNFKTNTLKIPETVTHLDLDHTSITDLPKLPKGLKFLRFMDTHITELPKKLPVSLEVLITNDHLKFFPELPSTLKDLHFYWSKKITKCPKLPEGLEGLYTNDTITSVPKLPKNIKKLNLGKNVSNIKGGLPLGITDLSIGKKFPKYKKALLLAEFKVYDNDAKKFLPISDDKRIEQLQELNKILKENYV